MQSIKNFETFIVIRQINSGWSNDTKFFIEDNSGNHFLLRLSDIHEFSQKEKEFNVLRKMQHLNINMSKPIDFGICDNGKKVYQLLSWCEGEEAKKIIQSFSYKEQYDFGVKAGEILRKMHTVETYPVSSKWSDIYGNKVKNCIKNYKKCDKKHPQLDILLPYLEKNIDILNNRPTCLSHADFQIDNMVISPQKELFIIDFEQSSIIDPYFDLMSAAVSADVSPQFAKGEIDEYFNGNPPSVFWKLFLFYAISESVNGYLSAQISGQEQQDFVNQMISRILLWFNNLKRISPTWYD